MAEKKDIARLMREEAWARLQKHEGRSLAFTTTRPAFLYVIVDDRGECKVGFSGNVERRCRDLQGARARKLTIYAREPVDCMYPTEAEAAAHAYLKRYRLRGEWFACHPEIALAAIRRAAWEAEDG